MREVNNWFKEIIDKDDTVQLEIVNWCNYNDNDRKWILDKVKTTLFAIRT